MQRFRSLKLFMNYILVATAPKLPSKRKLLMMKKYIFLAICLMFHKNNAEQFLYPVADFDHGNQLMLLYQKSLESVELWIWDSSNQRAIKGLSSFLTPVNLRMMPSGRGFSFIDQGYIKIKEFAKRSPRTLPIYEPIGLFSNMNWIDDETFYFVARQGDFFQVFQGDLQANIQRLTYEPADALYPQKIDSTLFYMKRDMNGQVTIVSKSWDPCAMDTNHDQSDNLTIIKESSAQLCFLRMVDQQEGFYLQAPTQKLNDDNDCYEFSCWHLKHDENQWLTEKLFSFKIPARYVTGSARLYESLEPFLPNYTCNDHIYFVSWSNESNGFELQKFHIPEKTVEKVSDQLLHRNSNQQFFAPYIHEDKIFCGLILNDKRFMQNIFEAGDVCFELPFLNEK